MEQKNTQHPKNLHYYMHTLHRWLGFFFIGMVVIYSLSGIVLTYRTTDLLKSEKTEETTIEPNLSADKLGKILKMRRFEVKSESADAIIFDGGSYDKQTGKTTYTTSEYVFPINKFIALHKTSTQSGIHWFTILFGTVLLFLALSSLFMSDFKSARFRQNMTIALAGVIFAVVLLIFI